MGWNIKASDYSNDLNFTLKESYSTANTDTNGDGNDKAANVTFKVDGTSDGSTPASQTIDAVNQGTAFTTTLFKTISRYPNLKIFNYSYD